MAFVPASSITDEQIRRLREASFAEGHAWVGLVCDLALADDAEAAKLTDAAWLNDNTCLDARERRKLVGMTREEARELAGAYLPESMA